MAATQEYDPKLRQYKVHYKNVRNTLYSEVRAHAYGVDHGQAGWMTPERQDDYIRRAGITADSVVVDIACGTGRSAIEMMRKTGCKAIGFEINADAVAFATEAAAEAGFADRSDFQCADAALPLPLADASVDVVLCIDAITHLLGRDKVMADWFRVLKPGGRLLFTDAMTLTGVITNEEIDTRTAIGLFQIVPPGWDDGLLEGAGFRIVTKDDISEDIVAVSRRWREARAERAEALTELEGADMFAQQQKFLQVTHDTSARRALTSFLFVAERPA